MILETERLYLREMERADLRDLCGMLQDPLVMYAYEHAFSNVEAQAWLDRQLERYARDGFGLWAVVEKESGELVGQCGLTWQDWRGRQVLEIGYHLRRDRWGRGYATEAARACKKYAFEALGAREVYSIIRDTNFASQRVALRNGMALRGSFIKRYYNMDMPHLVFCARREWEC